MASNGPNQLPVSPRPRLWRKVIAQLTHFFALMLWVAVVLAMVAGMPQLGIAIFVVVLVIAVARHPHDAVGLSR